MITSNFEMRFTKGRVQPKPPTTLEGIDTALFAREVAGELNTALDTFSARALAIRGADLSEPKPGNNVDLNPAPGFVVLADTGTVLPNEKKPTSSERAPRALLQFDPQVDQTDALQFTKSFDFRTADHQRMTFAKKDGLTIFTTNDLDVRICGDRALVTYLS